MKAMRRRRIYMKYQLTSGVYLGGERVGRPPRAVQSKGRGVSLNKKNYFLPTTTFKFFSQIEGNSVKDDILLGDQLFYNSPPATGYLNYGIRPP